MFVCIMKLKQKLSPLPFFINVLALAASSYVFKAGYLQSDEINAQFYTMLLKVYDIYIAYKYISISTN